MSKMIKALLELLSESPAAASPHEARDRILKALEKTKAVNKSGNPWTIQEFEENSNNSVGRYGDGWAAMLIGHVVYFNGNGAYRIIDTKNSNKVIFENKSASGSDFAEVNNFCWPWSSR